MDGKAKHPSDGDIKWQPHVCLVQNTLPSDDDPILSPLLPPWTGPHTVIIPRTEEGFGFTLRHFIVYPPGSTLQAQYQTEDDLQDENYPHGLLSCKRPKLRSLEPMETIFIKSVKEDSVAQNAGLNVGDRILSINDVPIIRQSYSQVISQIQNSEDLLLKLDVLPRDEDVLQMAYQSTNRNSLQEPLYHGVHGNSHGRASVRDKGQQVYSMTSNPSQGLATSGETGRFHGPERRFSASSLDEYADSDELKYRYNLGLSDKSRKMKSSTSYTSGLSVYREPQLKANASGGDLHKVMFNDRRRQFEVRSKENQKAPSKTYTLGLYYPSPKKASVQVKSSEGVSNSSSLYRRSADNILQSNDSLENITRSVAVKPQGRVIPLEQRSSPKDAFFNVGSSSAYSTSLSSSPSRHSYPDSSSAIANQNAAVPQSYASPTNSAGDQVNSDHHLTRHYVPVVSQTSSGNIGPKMSASVDGLDSRPGHYITERSLRTNYGSPVYDQQNQNGGERTFIVKIGNKTIETGGSSGQSNGQLSSGATVQMSGQYGSTFALTKSPNGAQIEIKQKDNRERPPIVSFRKQQFESGQNDNVNPGLNQNRYKTEIKKITSGKFTTVANRLQNFEKDGVQIRRMSSTERYSSPEPSSGHTSHSHSSERSTPQPQSTPQQTVYQDAAPIRIYVSQGTPHSSSSPLVEIMPMPTYQDSSMHSAQPMVMTSSKASLRMQSDDVDGMSDDENRSSRAVRKPSFLAAVNQQSRYGPSVPELPSPDSPPVSPWMGSHTSISSSGNAGMMSYSSLSSAVMPPPSSTGVTLTSTPIKDLTPSIMLRKKSESTPEEDAMKLQRRTSYLMATAKDRDSHKLSLDKSRSPHQPEADPNLITPNKHHSMRKLKAFFGERTPRILEATERRQDPASPIQEVAKEGTLHLKTDITDGKRSSDRSWKPVWAELRGHALYLHKERREPTGVVNPFSFEDQPISIKSSIVDIAYDYTKKKNVFRLKTYNGSEYLFQTDEHESMLSWIHAIQENNDPDSDEKGLGSKDLIIRKSNQYESGQPPSNPATKTSPQAPPKAIKKLQVLSLKPKIPHSPSIKRKKAETKDDSNKPKSFRGKFKSFRVGKLGVLGSGHSDEHEVTGMFGVPLACCIPSPNNDFVPLIVDMCTKIVEARGLEVTGVYRVPGNTAAVNHMQTELNKGIDNMNVDHEKWCDVNVISSLLKAFFRKLPDPLVTTDLYPSFINANRTEDPERRMLKVKRLLHDLPEHHFETFRHLAEHLNRVASFGYINRMDTRNLALMFGPTLIRQNNDDMSSIVKDMPDQCRIVESIIAHYEWFFSSWDQDSYVPLDEEENSRPTNTSFSKMSCDDEDNASNPNTIVSSFVQAAKNRGKGTEEHEMNQPPAPAYSERNIDLEVAKRCMNTPNVTTQSSPNLTTVLKTTAQQIQVIVRKTENPNDRRMAKSQEILDPDWDYIDSERQSQSMIIKARHYSEDSLDKNDELELSSHGGHSGGFSVSRDTIDRLRKIEEEARALREKEEKRRRDFERRKLERQKVEQDIQRTKKEIEYDDSQNVDDLLNSPSVWHSANELHRYPSAGHMRQDSVSATSDYSSVSSGTDHHSGPSWLKYGGMSDYSSSVSPASTNGEKGMKDPKHGGKYFVIQSVTSAKVLPTKRTNSLETMLEMDEEIKPRPYARITAKRGTEKPRWANREGTEYIRHSRGNLSRTNSVRRGSLDSLIDLIDRQDQKGYAYNSSDSEDGSDLLSDLTSTFDQKLKVLVNPKYKLNGSTSRLNKSDGSGSITGSVTSDRSERSEKSEKESNAPLRLPPQLPLAMCNKFGLCSSNDMLEKQYRDPSLHRSPLQRSDAKIGIAYRYTPTNSAGVTNSRENLGRTPTQAVTPYAAMSTEPRTTYMVVNPSPVTVFETLGKEYSPSSLSKDRTTTKTDYGVGRDIRPISKSEKTEVNVSLSKQVKEGQMTGADRPKFFVRDLNFGGHDKAVKARSSSPEPVRKSKRTKKRRHTVGSTNDEHFRALRTLSKPREEHKRSAWDRLQPGGGKDSQVSANQSLLSWMQNERLRASVPDLSAAVSNQNGNYS